jgi:RHS repeat-associated protein
MGNLTSDATTAYTYDSLNQLILDQPLDSLHNPPHTDHLNQLTTTPHDARGRPTTYTFDTFNRLTSTQTTTYTYDAFHRRISKQTPTQTIHYLWTDLHEIGAYTDHIIEYRPLGLTPNAEISSAPAFELEGQTHIPIYDNRGCVIALDDIHISYTPYGTPSATPSPWLFCSKRHDPETALTYFGRRYYSSSNRRFLTPDPLGHTPDPNLYAYCSNNPLSLLDLYGQFPVGPMHASPAAGQLARAIGGWIAPRAGRCAEFAGVHLLTEQHEREAMVKWGCRLQGKPYVAANYFLQPFSGRAGHQADSPFLRHRIIPGVRNTHESALAAAEYFNQNHATLPVHYSLIPGKGALGEANELSCLYMGVNYCAAVNSLANDIKNDFSELAPSGILVLYPHSKGVMATNEALKLTPQEYRCRIEVETIGGPDWVRRNSVSRAVNHFSPADPVAWLAWMKHGWNPSAYDVRMTSASHFGRDHLFRGDVYGPLMGQLIADAEMRHLPERMVG